ncbi:MAG: DUF1572 family protein [Saprospiraceae bacterium]|nr:DUF1572 family protein [Saprospiraceae bacterium]
MNPLIPLIQKEFHCRVILESRSRIFLCLNQVKIGQLNWRPNDQSNSIQNLILHLCGNMNQYIYSSLGDHPDERRRDDEFVNQLHLSHLDLQELLTKTTENAWDIVQKVDEKKLLNMYRVQCFELSGFEIISHVIEHFSYHTGQIALLTKILTNRDLGFYKGLKLN